MSGVSPPFDSDFGGSSIAESIVSIGKFTTDNNGIQSVFFSWRICSSGGLFEPAIVFLDEIKQLDKQHRTHVYSQVIYVILDISVKAIEESHANAKKHPGAQEHVDAGILQFEVHDAKKISSI